MKRSSVGALALCVLLLWASAAAAAPARSATLDLLVLDDTGLPAAYVPLLIETSDGDAVVLVTDEEGRAHAEFQVRGNHAVDLSVMAFGGSSADLTLKRGDSASTTLIVGPMMRGYEWAIVD